MRNYLKVNRGGAKNLNLSNKVDDNTNYERKKIKYLILLIFVVMFTVTGGTYAYFALSARNENTIVGTTATAGLDLVVERKHPSNVGVMVPQLEEYLGNAISDSHNCIDGNNNTVCQVYKATVTNTSTASVKINGTISFTGIDNMPNLKWKRLKNATTVGAYASYNATTTDAYFERNELFSPSETKEYYFVVWIDETGEAQTDSGTFRTTIKFNPATDGGLTSTIVPISYMKGFISKDDLSYYRSDTYRENIKNVYFVDYINTEGSVESWDMSDLNMNSAGSVMAWVNTNTTDSNYYDLYIGAEQLIGVIDCSWLFRDMTNVVSINFDNFDTRVTTNMTGMFLNCVGLTTLDVSGFDTSNVTDMTGMFAGNGETIMNLEYLDVSGFNTSNVTSMYIMFQNCVKLANLDVSGFDTSKVTKMQNMFYKCRELISLDVSGFDTSNVTSMAGMFNDCRKLTILDVSGFNTNKVIDMTRMFFNCVSLTNLNVSGFDTSNVTSMQVMFGSNSEVGVMNLEYLDVSGFNTSKVIDMAGMFQNCTKLTTLDVSKWDVSKVTNMQSMFLGTYDPENNINNFMSLTNLNLSSWNTLSVTNMRGMFKNCAYLTTTIPIKNSGVTDYTNMFFGAATETGASITVNYTSATSSLVDSMIATKSSNSNVVKGSLVS